MKSTLKKMLLLTLVVTLCLGQSTWALATDTADFTAGADAVFSAAGVDNAVFADFTAGAGLTKNESVFVLLNSDGSVQEQIVSSWLHNDGGLSGVQDVSVLQDIVNLKGSVQPRRSGNTLLWDTSDRDVYYQGTTTQQLPVTATISYTLNGKPIAPERLAGQSGDVEIRIKLQNHYMEEQSVDGKTRPIAPVFMAAVLVDLPAENFYNVDAPDGMLLSESQNQMIAFAGVPGLKESFDGIMDDKLTDLKDKLKDEFVITAHTEEFTLPPIMIAVANDSALFEDGTYDAEADLDELLDGVDDLNEATDELFDGTHRLSDAGVDFNTNMQKLHRNYVKFQDGMRDAREGTSELSSTVKNLSGTAGSMLSQNNRNDAKVILKNAANLMNMKAELDAMAKQLPPELLPMLTGPDTPEARNAFEDAVCARFAQPVAEMLAAHGNDLIRLLTSMSAPAAEAPEAAPEAPPLQAPSTPIPDALDSGMTVSVRGAYIRYADPLDSGITADTDADASYSAAQMAQLTQAVTAMLKTDLQPQLTQAWGAARKAAAYYQALDESCTELESAATDLVAHLPAPVQKKLAPVLANLSDPAKAGAALDALAAELSGDLNLMSEKTGELSSGLDTLCSASTKLQAAILEFTDATDELQDKTAQMADGLHEFRVDGIQELTGDVNDMTDDARELVHIKDAVSACSQSFTTYTGAPENADTSVKFVMRTAEIKPEKAPEPEPEPEQKTTLGERIKNLFS